MRRPRRKKKMLLLWFSLAIVFVISGFFITNAFALGKHSTNKSADSSAVVKVSDENTSTEIVKDESKPEEKEPEYKEIKGVSNILLIGTDARKLDEQARSDSIMILTVDSNHKKLKLTSIMRDTFVEIPNHGEQKINHSYFYGGPELLMETIEKNFKIKIDHYAIINFFGFKDLIDSLGGIDVDIKQKEIKPINDVINGTVKQIPEFKKEYKPIKKAGMQHLNGLQALSYSRVRHVGDGDFDRSQRQREVITLVIDKLKDTSVFKYPTVISKFMPYIKTDMRITDMANYAYTVYKIGNFMPIQMQMPVSELSSGKILNKKGWVLLMDKEQNTEILHDFLYEDKEYDKTQINNASLKQSINEYIAQYGLAKKN
mgnify:CR=1 FL=1